MMTISFLSTRLVPPTRHTLSSHSIQALPRQHHPHQLHTPLCWTQGQLYPASKIQAHIPQYFQRQFTLRVLEKECTSPANPNPFSPVQSFPTERTRVSSTQ